jgi:hypothetical protein
MDGWTRIDETRETVFEEELGDSTIEAKAHTVAYGDRQLREAIEAELGPTAHPVSTVAASRVVASGGLAGAPDDGVAEAVETAARERFESRLHEAGIENVERTSAESVTVDSGATARYRRYVADLSVDTDAAAEAGIDSIPVAGDLATWRAGDSSIIAGAAYPAESLSATAERQGGDASGIDTGFDPVAYRQEVRAILTGVE